MDNAKAEVDRILGRDVGVEATTTGKFICKFVDYNNPHPAALVGETEEIAYSNLLGYLRSRDGNEEAAGKDTV
jgi:hypothetical protein